VLPNIQSIVARSSLTPTFSAAYAFIVWMVAGMVSEGWWLQMLCMGATTYIMVELNNSNALLRVRSLMVSSVFLILSSVANFLFSSLRGAVVGMLFTAALLPLFRSYQDENSQSLIYGAFLLLGIASLFQVHILYFLPALWVLCFTHLQSLNVKSWVASLLGLATPYWLLLPWVMLTHQWHLAVTHFTALTLFRFPIRYHFFTEPVLATIIFIVVLTCISMIHLWHHSYEDRIRIRQLYGFFTIMEWLAFIFLFIQPQHYELLLRLTIICSAPLIAHFFTLTNTKFTNWLFMATCLTAVILTIYTLTFQFPA